MKRWKYLVCFLPAILGLLLVFSVYAVTTSVNMGVNISDLGPSGTNINTSFTATTPGALERRYKTMDANDTPEIVNMGSISTVEGIWIYHVDDGNDSYDTGLLVDCDYNDTSFDADILIAEGQSAYFKPAGTVYIDCDDDVNTPTFEYLAFGTE